MKKPDAYRMELRKISDIAAWLLSESGWKTRSYDSTTWLFCFDVKLHDIDFSFDSLLQTYRKHVGDVRIADPVWLAGCRRVYTHEVDPVDGRGPYDLIEQAATTVREQFWCRGTQRPEDNWTQLWNGTRVKPRFSFCGRGGGWLVLTEFNGIDCTRGALGSYLQTACKDFKLSALSATFFRQLYQYILMLRRDLGPGKAKAAVEYTAADIFFNVMCCDVVSPVAARAQRVRQAKRLDEYNIVITDSRQRSRTIVACPEMLQTEGHAQGGRCIDRGIFVP